MLQRSSAARIDDAPPQDHLGVGASGSVPSTSDARLVLCHAVVPLWQRHLATVQDHAELAVAEMLSAFADIHPYMQRSLQQTELLHAALMASDDGLDHLSQVCDALLLPLVPGLDAEDAQAVLQALDCVHRAVGRVERIAQPLASDAPQLLRQVERMMVGLQYQDRISQMMALLNEDMQHMQELLAATTPDHQRTSSAAWMERLESRYAMAAQRDAHHGAADPGGAAALSQGAEPDYF